MDKRLNSSITLILVDVFHISASLNAENRASGFAIYGPVPVNTTTQFNLSGVSRDYNNVAIDGVTISATGMSAIQNLTDGSHQFTVPRGWSGTITASKPGWVFSNTQQLYV